MTFGEKLKEARKAEKMTQEQLADILSVSRQAITKWESDKGIPDVENLKLISQALSVSIDYLLDDGNKLDMSVIREPINLDDYKSLNATGKNRWFKWDKLRDEVVRKRFPKAEIYMLMHKQIMTKKEKKIWGKFVDTHKEDFLCLFQRYESHPLFSGDISDSFI